MSNTRTKLHALTLPEAKSHTHTVKQACQTHGYLLVRLHLASHYPEGIVGGVVIDLDSAEGLGSSTCRQPLLIAIIIDHHSGPSLANTGLTGKQTARQEETMFLSFNKSIVEKKKHIKKKCISLGMQVVNLREKKKKGTGNKASL